MSKTEQKPPLWDELTSPVIFTLFLVIAYLIYKSLRAKFETESETAPPIQRLPELDLTEQDLITYDGYGYALNPTVFLQAWENSFCRSGPYTAFSGTDATRGLATGTVAGSDKEYDDVSYLTPDKAAKEWEEQLRASREFQISLENSIWFQRNG